MREWVEVKKRKPNKSAFVYVAKRMKDDHSIEKASVSLAWYSQKDDEFCATLRDGEEVYAWMPHYFPKPPTDEKLANMRRLLCVCGRKGFYYCTGPDGESYKCYYCGREGKPVKSGKSYDMTKAWNDMIRAEMEKNEN